MATQAFGYGARWIAAALSLFAASLLTAQVTRDSSKLKVPPQNRVPVAPPKRPVPINTPTPSPVQGYEIVTGPTVTMAPLTIASASAQCPLNKVALSAGLEALAAGDATFGLEVLGAWADGGRNGEIRVRNANVFVQARIQAYAVCIADTPGRRQVDASVRNVGVTMNEPCAEMERVAGGGTMTPDVNLILFQSGPFQDGATKQTSWGTFAYGNIAGGMIPIVQSRAICYPALAMRGWQFVEGPRVSLGAHGQSTITANCPGGTVPLAFGVVRVGDVSNDHFMLVWNTLVPSMTGTVTAHVHNRNIAVSNGSTFVQINAVCAERA